MYEFHGWFTLAESTEEADTGTLNSGVRDIKDRMARLNWATGCAELLVLNGEYYVRLDGLMNRWRDEADALNSLLDYIVVRFPGSWGLLYERSDELTPPPGPGAFRVRVMARGSVVTRLDPFLSPVNPAIED